MLLRRYGSVMLIFVCMLGLLMVPNGGGPAPASPPLLDLVCHPDPGVLAAVPQWRICLFAQGKRTYSIPDSLARIGDHVFVAYKNQSHSDGSGTATSSVVEYTSQGALVRDWALPGRTDGMRAGPDGKLYVLCNPDANPRIFVIAPQSSDAPVEAITLPPVLPHGGGLDDIAFVGGQIFVSASNPTHLVNGINRHPAIYQLTIHGTTGQLSPYLLGNASAFAITLDPATGHLQSTPTTLHLDDPDSLLVDPQGDLVLTNVATQQVVTIRNPTTVPTVTVVTAGTVADEVAWEPLGMARMLVADERTNRVYEVRGPFDGHTTLVSASEGQTTGLVGKMDPGGGVTPLIIGPDVSAPSSFLFLTRDT